MVWDLTKARLENGTFAIDPDLDLFSDSLPVGNPLQLLPFSAGVDAKRECLFAVTRGVYLGKARGVADGLS